MNGKEHPAGRSCSIRDLARYVGLSTCTVSKVLNNRAGRKIPPATQERVLAAARELNYVPNVNAQRLFRRRSGVIGLLVPAHPMTPGNVFGDSHFVDILSGMEPRLEESDYHLMLLFRNEEKRPDESYQRLFRAGTIDGLLIWGASPECGYHRELEENGMPYLFITSTPAAEDSVQANTVASVRLVTRFSRYVPDEARNAAFEALKREQFDGILNVSRDMTPGVLEAAEAFGTGGDMLRMATLDCASNRPLLPQELAAGQVDDLSIGRAAIDSLIELIERKTARISKRIPGTLAVNPRFFTD